MRISDWSSDVCSSDLSVPARGAIGLLGRPVDQVVGCRDGSPARIVAPDPRWFALHKLWMSQQLKRNPQKRPKDRAQGLALLDAVAVSMPHYPLDDCFEAALPPELRAIYNEWTSRRPETDGLTWSGVGQA